MRFMMIMIPRVYQPDAPPGEKAGEGFAPPAEAVAKMMKFNEELGRAGALVALHGARPRLARCSKSRTSLKTSGKQRTTRRCARRSKSEKPRDAPTQEEIMKYICLGYFDEKKWEALSER